MEKKKEKKLLILITHYVNKKCVNILRKYPKDKVHAQEMMEKLSKVYVNDGLESFKIDLVNRF